MARGRADSILEYCRGLPGATEDVKWGNDLVFSVGAKMFVVFALPDCESLSLKVAGPAFVALTQREGIEPAPYMARHSWIRIAPRRTLPIGELRALILESHTLVAERLSKTKRVELGLRAD